MEMVYNNRVKAKKIMIQAKKDLVKIETQMKKRGSND